MSAAHSELSLGEAGRALVEALGGRWALDRGMCRCPAHDDRTPSLSVRLGRSRLLFHCFAGCKTSAILRALKHSKHADALAVGGGDRERKPARDEWLAEAVLRLWGGGRPIEGTRAADYLAARAIPTLSAELRFHPRTPHGPKPLTCFRPALIAAVRDDTGLVAVHRTFLDPRHPALADIADPRSALGPLGRGAVRLGGVARRLGLAEGIETALSASLLFDIPCWATLGTERFARIALPDEVEEVLLFLDNDCAGRRAESLAREAFEGQRTIEPHYPRRRGWDWNDVLRAMARRRDR